MFVIQAEVAGAEKSVPKSRVTHVERVIRAIEGEVPAVTHFIISGESLLAAHLDYARTLARRAERSLVAARSKKECHTGTHTLAYLNRLSSLLFALARYAEYKEGALPKSPSYK